MKIHKLSTRGVFMRPGISDDSRYAILPVIETARVIGWKVYDAATGQLLTRPGNQFTSYSAAEDWVQSLYTEDD